MARKSKEFQYSALSSFCERTLKAKPPKIPSYSFRGQEHKLPSVNTTAAFVGAKVTQQYTGDAMIGIATLHKSNAVPVFTEQEAQDISKMRRG